MGYEVFADITNQAIKIGLLISAPMLIGGLLMGILVSLFQAVLKSMNKLFLLFQKLL